MIAQMTQSIMELMKTHGSLTVFLGVIIESIIVPIPSPLIIMGAGALLIEPGLSWESAFWHIFTQIVLPGSVASTLGAYFTYGLCYWGGKRLINRYHGFLGFSWDDVLAIEKRLSKRRSLHIFSLRALPVVPLSLVSAAAGGLRTPFWMFTWASFLGSIPRCILLGYLGYLTRDSYEGLASRVNHMESLVSGAIVVFAFALILWLRRRARR